MQVLASTVLTSMGRGSGVDVIKLARDLTDVTKLPARGTAE